MKSSTQHTASGGIGLAAALPHPPILVSGIGSAADFTEAHASREAYADIASRIVAAAPETIVIATPHGRVYRDSFFISAGAGARGNWRDFGRDPERYELAFDEEFVSLLTDTATTAGIPCVNGADAVLDHGVMVPLHFLLAAGLEPAGCKFVRISISFADEKTHYRLGCCVQEVALALGRRTVFIASGDLSHRLKKSGPYGFAPEGPVFDAQISEIFKTGDFAQLFSFSGDFRERAGECGLNSFLMMAGVFDGYDVDAHLYSYEGPWGVGYGIAGFTRGEMNEERRFVS